MNGIQGSHSVESGVATRLESIKPWDALSSPWVDRRPMTNSLERFLNRASASQGNPQVTLAWPQGLFERVHQAFPGSAGEFLPYLFSGPASNRTVSVLPQRLML
jgi:hypothetical protein